MYPIAVVFDGETWIQSTEPRLSKSVDLDLGQGDSVGMMRNMCMVFEENTSYRKEVIGQWRNVENILNR